MDASFQCAFPNLMKLSGVSSPFYWLIIVTIHCFFSVVLPPRIDIFCNITKQPLTRVPSEETRVFNQSERLKHFSGIFGCYKVKQFEEGHLKKHMDTATQCCNGMIISSKNAVQISIQFMSCDNIHIENI